MEPGDETTNPIPGSPYGEDGAGTSGFDTSGTGPGAGDTWNDELGGETTSGRSEQAARARETAQRWLGQLQVMIDNAAREAGPVLRDVAAKAAELAAVAGENAGPIAHKAADMTDKVGARVAERSKVFAADLRRQASEANAQKQAEDDLGGGPDITGGTPA